MAEGHRGGRKRDPSRDVAILEATLDVLADVGWDGLTMDLVAQHAGAGKATLYRRWTSKLDLVVEAATKLAADSIRTVGDGLPDTGTLRGDLLSLLSGAAESGRYMRIVAALTAMMLQHTELSEPIDAALHEPWVNANRIILERAIARGEVSADLDLDLLSRVLPALAAYRILLQHRDFDREHATALIDQVLLPALAKSS